MIRVRPGMDLSIFSAAPSHPDLRVTALSEVVEIRIVRAHLTMGQARPFEPRPGYGFVDIYDLVARLRDATKRGVRVALVAIDSRGGIVEAGEILYRELGAFRDRGGYVVAYVHGDAISCAAWEWLSADYVVMAPWAGIWVHGSWVWPGAAGEAVSEPVATALFTRDIEVKRSILMAETIAPAELIDSWIGTPSRPCSPGASVAEEVARTNGAILNAQDAVDLAFCDEIGGWGTAEAIARAAINGTPRVSPRRQRLAARGPAASEGTHQVCTPEENTMANQPMLVGGLLLGLGAACLGPAESDNQQDSTTRVPESPCDVSEALPYTPQSGDGLQPQGEDVLSSIPTLVDGKSIGLENVALGPMVVSNWAERANPKNAYLLGVAWNPASGLLAAVGTPDATDAYIITSPDGYVWTERSNPKNLDLLDVIWSPVAGFVAVGWPDATDAYIVTSPDGVTWTERANPKNVALNGIAWSPALGLLVAVGDDELTDAYIVTSPDGVTWTERANPKNVALNGIAWSPTLGLLVAVGQGDGTDAYVITSPDGVTWTERANPKNVALNDIVWSQALGIFVAVGDPSGSGAYIVTSSDGITWVEQNNPGRLPLKGIAYSDVFGFVAVGNGDVFGNTDAYVITSPDGVTWTERANPKNVTLNDVAWSQDLGLFVAAGNADGTDAYVITSLALPRNTPNLATNPGFESGDTDWVKQSTWSVVNDAANARSGGWCAKAINPAFSAVKNGVYNGVQAARGDAFYAEAWIKSSAGATANAFVRITWIDAGGTEIGFSNGNTISATTSYQKSSVTGAAPANTAFASVHVVANASTGTWYADDVLLKAL